MDIETLIGALTASERDELLERLTTAAGSGENESDHAHGDSGCCGGGRSMERRRAMRAEVRQMCCAG
jgi:hypothetical protein